MKKLLIVESPTKARKISGLVPKGIEVIASVGHVCDLPEKEMGIDLETMRPTYVYKSGLAKMVNSAKKADVILLGTDPDREGEAIADHIRRLLVQKHGVDKNVIQRVTFNEITSAAVNEALANPRKVDSRLCKAQELRRLYDRLMGYGVSPVLWEKFGQQNLSAGRVQSPALMILVERERERRAFKPEPFFQLNVTLGGADGSGVTAYGPRHRIRARAERDATALRRGEYTVKYNARAAIRKPAPPCDTASLIRECASKWNISSEQVMAAAQALFTSGRITYHRTDSIRLGMPFVGMAGKHVRNTFGKKYHTARAFSQAAGAHEAIRPTSMKPPAPLPAKFPKVPVEHVYTVVWERAVASQGAEVQLQEQRARFYSTRHENSLLLEVRGGEVTFDGFLPMMPVLRPNGLGLRPVRREDLKVLGSEIVAGFTDPPRPITESDMVATLKRLGLGRPSTYASIMSSLRRHSYIRKTGSVLAPTLRGEMVAGFLARNLKHVVDAEFTASMERTLDRVASGELRNHRKGALVYWNDKLQPKIKKAAKWKADANAPVCSCQDRRGQPLTLKIGWKGNPYWQCEACKTYQGLDFDSEGKPTAFRSEQVRDTVCLHCGKDTVFTAQSNFGPYTLCVSKDCGKPQRKLTPVEADKYARKGMRRNQIKPTDRKRNQRGTED